jgi:acetyl-CoA carboxylase carboxyltransferase component
LNRVLVDVGTDPVALDDPLLAIAAGRRASVEAGLDDLHGQTVGRFRLAGGDAHGAIGAVEGSVLARLVRQSVDAGVPIVGVLDTSGADVREGVAALHAWGTIARALATASGVVPVILVVTGSAVSGPALLLGLADVVIATVDAVAYVSGPATVAAMTGRTVTREQLGGVGALTGRAGVAHVVAADEAEALDLAADILGFLPANVSELPRVWPASDPVDRPCLRAAALVPSEPTAPYDVRELVVDVVDDGDFLELRAGYAAALVTGLARIDGRPVGIVANQPLHLAGTLDIEASRKGARFVRWCDAFGLPLVTFVDTPGFLPGVEHEWRGMIRHGAQLAFSYALATVPRLCVVVRKAYGGAYIVMDAKAMGNDLCVAWPGAELAVMGAPGAVSILHRRELAADPSRRADLESAYADAYCSPQVALERGYVDRLIDPADTRRILGRGLRALAAKRERLPKRKHDNTPL